MAEVRAIHESGYERQEGDFYPTPAWVTECLLSNVTLRGPMGAVLWRWRPREGPVGCRHEVVATDLVDRGFGRGGVDLLKTSEMRDRHTHSRGRRDPWRAINIAILLDGK